VVKQQVKIPVHVMIRPRAGDFHYSDQEMDVMRTDVRILKENGADGFVLGLLHRSSRRFQFVLIIFVTVCAQNVLLQCECKRQTLTPLANSSLNNLHFTS